ncbi:hypothetical protein CC80DRAFT_598050 [Byssothecium circinans]|uniref:Uncharacterized protein n=1 Tax=Byssothecium circinans TaxID=147558 RepID=A0A6A5TDE5_9PLEO|nr:hypothetical protein CC80DRAFT_598050 [Byssothecium circinans]
MSTSTKQPLNTMSASSQNRAMVPAAKPASPTKIPTRSTSPLKKEVRLISLAQQPSHSMTKSTTPCSSPSKASTNTKHGSSRASTRQSTRPSTRPSTPTMIEFKSSSGHSSSPAKRETLLLSSATLLPVVPTTPLKFQLHEVDGAIDKNGRFTPGTPAKGDADLREVDIVQMEDCALQSMTPEPQKMLSDKEEAMATTPQTAVKMIARKIDGLAKEASPTKRTTKLPTATPQSEVPATSSPVKRPRTFVRTSTAIPLSSSDLPASTKAHSAASSSASSAQTSLVLTSRSTSGSDTPTRSIFLPANLYAKTMALAKVDMKPRRRAPKAPSTEAPANKPATDIETPMKSRVPIPSSIKRIPSATILPARRTASRDFPLSYAFATPRAKTMADLTRCSTPKTSTTINTNLYRPVQHPRSPFVDKLETTINRSESQDDVKPGEDRIASAEHVAGMVREWKSKDKYKMGIDSPAYTPTSSPSHFASLPSPSSDDKDSHTPEGSPSKTVYSLRIPKTRMLAPKTPSPSKTMLSRIRSQKAGAVYTPSKKIASALDLAIDRHIEEEVKGGRESTPSGQKFVDLLEKRRASAEGDIQLAFVQLFEEIRLPNMQNTNSMFLKRSRAAERSGAPRYCPFAHHLADNTVEFIMDPPDEPMGAYDFDGDAIAMDIDEDPPLFSAGEARELFKPNMADIYHNNEDLRVPGFPDHLQLPALVQNFNHIGANQFLAGPWYEPAMNKSSSSDWICGKEILVAVYDSPYPLYAFSKQSLY